MVTQTERPPTRYADGKALREKMREKGYETVAGFCGLILENASIRIPPEQADTFLRELLFKEPSWAYHVALPLRQKGPNNLSTLRFLDESIQIRLARGLRAHAEARGRRRRVAQMDSFISHSERRLRTSTNYATLYRFSFLIGRHIRVASMNLIEMERALSSVLEKLGKTDIDFTTHFNKSLPVEGGYKQVGLDPFMQGTLLKTLIEKRAVTATKKGGYRATQVRKLKRFFNDEYASLLNNPRRYE